MLVLNSNGLPGAAAPFCCWLELPAAVACPCRGAACGRGGAACCCAETTITHTRNVAIIGRISLEPEPQSSGKVTHAAGRLQRDKLAGPYSGIPTPENDVVEHVRGAKTQVDAAPLAHAE